MHTTSILFWQEEKFPCYHLWWSGASSRSVSLSSDLRSHFEYSSSNLSDHVISEWSSDFWVIIWYLSDHLKFEWSSSDICVIILYLISGIWVIIWILSDHVVFEWSSDFLFWVIIWYLIDHLNKRLRTCTPQQELLVPLREDTLEPPASVLVE